MHGSYFVNELEQVEDLPVFGHGAVDLSTQKDLRGFVSQMAT